MNILVTRGWCSDADDSDDDDDGDGVDGDDAWCVCLSHYLACNLIPKIVEPWVWRNMKSDCFQNLEIGLFWEI